MERTLIKDIPNEERPRERMLYYGVENLSNEELLAIILKSGTKEVSSKQLASNLLTTIGHIHNLIDISIPHLTKIKGIGLVKAIELKAAVELGHRVYEPKHHPKVLLDQADKIYRYCRHLFWNKKQEFFYCLYLDAKKNLIAKKLLFMGTLNKSIVHPREIFKEAYLLSASTIVCVHNHPSGDIVPSKEDIYFTTSIVKIGQLQGIPIIDHIIMSDNDYYSFFANNRI